MIRVKNPILPGFYPDPSICRVGDDYYMVNSTFAYFPGIPVFHSRNLADWEQIGNVLTRSSQVVLDGCGHSEGIYAPTIRYHNGIFYVITTNVSGGGNFIVAAKNLAGPWTDPVYLGEEAQGIDPSLFFDEDGSCWYVGQRERTGGGAYFGDCEIWVRKLNLPEIKRRLFTWSEEADGVQGVSTVGNFQEKSNDTCLKADDAVAAIQSENTEELLDMHKLFSGNDTVLAYGYARKAVWAEGPHLYKKDGYYYLVHSEMGTEQNHCVVVARSRALTGPYEYSLANPILTHRHLGKDYPVTCVGHADLVEDGQGNWYLVALGCRPVEGHTLMGRETFLAKVVWEDDWPVVNPGVGHLEEEVLLPEKECSRGDSESLQDTEKREARVKKLPPEFLMLRNPEPDTVELRGDRIVRLYMKAETLKDCTNPAYLAVRQQYRNFVAEVEVTLPDVVFCENFPLTHCDTAEKKSNLESGCAGLAYVQSNEAHIRMECFRKDGVLWLRIVSCIGGIDHLLAQTCMTQAAGKTVQEESGAGIEEQKDRMQKQKTGLRICVNGLTAVFQWKTYVKNALPVDTEWNTIIADVDLRHMSTETAGGFVGCTVGMYAAGNDKKCNGYAEFNNFCVRKI